MSGIQIAGIVFILFLIWFWSGARKRRDERFRNLGFDGYRGFKESSEESKEQLRSDYQKGVSEGILIGREYDEAAYKKAKKLIDNKNEDFVEDLKEPFNSLREELIEKYSSPFESVEFENWDPESVVVQMNEDFHQLDRLMHYCIEEQYTDEELNHNLPEMRSHLGLPEKS
tara:strand:+ start:126 stop:638 length:513 start_codon:yes stop_codon:yes gene_type:complete